MIVAARWLFDDKKSLEFVYNCDRCKSRGQKLLHGCKIEKDVFIKKNKKNVGREIDCICSGDKNCKLCKGENKFRIYTCPRNILIEPEINRLIPYFYDYVSSNCQLWPCGKRYDTPIKLQQCFEILLTVYNLEKAKGKSKDE